MSTAKDSAKVAAGHLRRAAKLAAQGGRRRTMAPIRNRAIRAMEHLARALAIAEKWEQGRRALARKRAFSRRAENTVKRLASDVEPRRTKP